MATEVYNDACEFVAELTPQEREALWGCIQYPDEFKHFTIMAVTVIVSKRHDADKITEPILTDGLFALQDALALTKVKVPRKSVN